MPHVVIEGRVDLRAWARDFEPLLLRKGGDVLRIDQGYLELGGRSLLLEALVVESGRKLPFYIKISSHERGSATLRVDPLTYPERSEGVRALVAHVGALLLARTPGARLGSANVVLPSLGTQGLERGKEEASDEDRQ